MIAAANFHKRFTYHSADILREEERFSLSCEQLK